MELKTYLYKLKLLTPTIITSAYGFRGMSYTITTNFIPGSIVRGGILEKLIAEGLLIKDDVNREAVNPLHTVSPALPVPEAESEMLPLKDVVFAHALSYQVKGDDAVYSFGLDELLERIRKENDVDAALANLVLKTMISFDRKAYEDGAKKGYAWVLRSSSEVKPSVHHVIARKDKSWHVVGLRKGIYVENAVERSRGSVAPGMLYAYEYIEPGQRFVGFITLSKNSYLLQSFESVDGSCMKVRIGRGLGRGFGISELCLREIDSEVFAGGDVIKDSVVAIYTFSPFAIADPLPRPSKVGDEVEIDVFGEGIAKLKIIAILGREIVEYRGWSYRTLGPKLPVRALGPGSLLIARVLDLKKSDVLKFGSPVGLAPLSAQGFNIITPLDKDFIPKVTSG